MQLGLTDAYCHYGKMYAESKNTLKKKKKKQADAL